MAMERTEYINQFWSGDPQRWATLRDIPPDNRESQRDIMRRVHASNTVLARAMKRRHHGGWRTDVQHTILPPLGRILDAD